MKCLLLSLLILTGCTTTEQGRSLDRSNYADLASTAIALGTGNGAEANPLGYALVPLKLSMAWFVEENVDDCLDRATIAGAANSVYYGAAVNNLIVAASVPYAPVFGLAAGVAYYFNKERIEPDTFSCVPSHPALQALARSYAEGDAEILSDAFTEGALTEDMVGLEEIKGRYSAFYEATGDKRLYFRNEKYLSVQIDDLWWHYKYKMTFVDEKIDTYFFERVTVGEIANL